MGKEKFDLCKATWSKGRCCDAGVNWRYSVVIIVSDFVVYRLTVTHDTNSMELGFRTQMDQL